MKNAYTAPSIEMISLNTKDILFLSNEDIWTDDY